MILVNFNVEREADDPIEIKRLIENGYVPVKAEAAPPPREPEAEEIPARKPYTRMSKKELVALAGEAGIISAGSKTKAELVEILEAQDE